MEMARIRAFTLAIWLVIAVIALQAINCDAEDGETISDALFKTMAEENLNKLLDNKHVMTPDETWKVLDEMTPIKDRVGYDLWREWLNKDLGLGLTVKEAHQYSQLKLYRCAIGPMSEFNRHYQQADRQKSASLRQYLTQKYAEKMALCDERFLKKLEQFILYKRREWSQFKEFFDAVKNNKRLYAELRENRTDLSEEMKEGLANVLKAKKPDVEDDYKSGAIIKLRNSCNSLRNWFKWGNGDEWDTAKMIQELGRSVKREPQPEHIFYWDLCDRVRKIVLPMEELRDQLVSKRGSQSREIETKYDNLKNAELAKLSKHLDPEIDELQKELSRLANL